MLIHSMFIPHVLIGGVVLALYWLTILNPKGSAPHKRYGRVFYAMLILVLISVVPIFVFRDGQLSGPEGFVRLLYLSVSLTATGMVGFTAIRFKSDLERFRGPHFAALGTSMFLLGGVVLIAGLATGQPQPVVLSSFGLVFGGAMVRFWRLQDTPHPKWWLMWHLNAICLLFSAVHGSFLSVTWRTLVDPNAGVIVPCITHGGTLLIALAMRIWFGRRYGVPMRFVPAQPKRVAAT